MKFSSSVLAAALFAKCHAGVIDTLSPRDTPQCTNGPQTVAGRSCNIQCGLDRPGGDYAASNTGTFNGCVQACAADPVCVTAQFNEGNGYCYLKNARNNGGSSTNTDTVDCDTTSSTSSTSATTSPAAPLCTPGTSVINSRSCTTTCGLDRPGGDYSSLPTTDFSGCVQACAASLECVTAQYHELSGYCYLKNVTNAGISSGNDDTVDCGLSLLSPDGASCSHNSSCANSLCNSFGKCGTLALNQFCLASSDCHSGYCSIFTAHCIVQLLDGQGSCFSASACASGFCNTGHTCGKLADGQGECIAASDCLSGYCSSSRICGKLSDGQQYCGTDSDCLSGHCRNAEGICGILSDGQGVCFDPSDCSSGYCSSTQLCGKLANGDGYCGQDSDCMSDHCNDATGVCGVLPDGQGPCVGPSDCLSDFCTSFYQCGKVTAGFCYFDTDCSGGVCEQHYCTN